MDRRSFLATGLLWGWASTSSGQTQGADLTLTGPRALLSAAHLSGQSVKAAFDTGARISSISESLARRIGVVGDRDLRLNTTRGELRVKTTPTVNVDIPGFPTPAGRWAIIPDAMQPGADCVIGAAALDQFTLAFSRGKVFPVTSVDDGVALDIRRAPVPIGNFRADGDPFTLVIDSGADLSWIDASVAESIIAEGGVAVLRYLTPTGPSIRAIRIPVLTCGDAQFRDVLFRVRSGGSPISSRRVSLGGFFGLDAMRLRDWSFSGAHSRVRVSAGVGGRQTWVGLGIDFRTDGRDPGRVLGLAENGPAMRAGLRLGDRIVTLGGVRLTSTDQDAMAKVASCGCLETISAVFERDGSISEVSVTTGVAI